MLTLEDARFYIEPVVDHVSLATKVYVLDTRNKSRQEEFIGKIVEVRKDRYYADGKAWAITGGGGNYVYGSPILTNYRDISINRPCLAFVEDVFIVGTRGSHNGGQLSVRNPRYSVQTPLSGRVAGDLYDSEYQVDTVISAASWAYDLMPEIGDSNEVIEAKLNLAKEKYRQRRAFIHLHQQSVSRGWQDTMEELRGVNDLIPLATYGMRINGIAFVPYSDASSATRTAMSESAVASIAPRDNISTTNNNIRVGTTIGVSFSVPGTFSSPQEVNDALERNIQNHWDDISGYSGHLMSAERTSIVSGLAL